MKHIKRFNENKIYIEDIEDILLELREDGFRVDINTDCHHLSCDYFVNITKPNGVDFRGYTTSAFKWYEIKEYVFRLVDYLGIPCRANFKFIKGHHDVYPAKPGIFNHIDNITEENCKLDSMYDVVNLSYFNICVDINDLFNKLDMND